MQELSGQQRELAEGLAVGTCIYRKVNGDDLYVKHRGIDVCKVAERDFNALRSRELIMCLADGRWVATAKCRELFGGEA